MLRAITQSLPELLALLLQNLEIPNNLFFDSVEL